MVWQFVIGLIIALAMASQMRSKPEEPVATGLDDFNIPQNSLDRVKPVVMGTRWITSPNIADYGDYRAVPIVKDAGGGGK